MSLVRHVVETYKCRYVSYRNVWLFEEACECYSFAVVTYDFYRSL